MQHNTEVVKYLESVGARAGDDDPLMQSPMIDSMGRRAEVGDTNVTIPIPVESSPRDVQVLPIFRDP